MNLGFIKARLYTLWWCLLNYLRDSQHLFSIPLTICQQTLVAFHGRGTMEYCHQNSSGKLWNLVLPHLVKNGCHFDLGQTLTRTSFLESQKILLIWETYPYVAQPLIYLLHSQSFFGCPMTLTLFLRSTLFTLSSWMPCFWPLGSSLHLFGLFEVCAFSGF